MWNKDREMKKMTENLLSNREIDLGLNNFYNPGAEIDKSFYLEKTLDLGAYRCVAPNPIKSLRKHLYILDSKHFWKWCYNGFL
jgi:hypothetical protein